MPVKKITFNLVGVEKVHLVDVGRGENGLICLMVLLLYKTSFFSYYLCKSEQSIMYFVSLMKMAYIINAEMTDRAKSCRCSTRMSRQKYIRSTK